MRDILFLKPVFKETVWGGSRLKSEFQYAIPSEHTGECWGIAAHKNGDCEVVSGEYEGWKLSRLWNEHRELFGNLEGEQFPLLVKILDANEDMSIQVHPDDIYARNVENSPYGKMECWYVLDCAQDGDIVIGHYAKDKQELEERIQENEWDKLIRRIPIHRGDFFQINPGCVHAIKAGTLILETQQNSDITYRLYDYGRLQNGKPRELHIEKCLDVITVPHKDVQPVMETYQTGQYQRIRLIDCPYYTVEKWVVQDKCNIRMDYPFMNVSVIQGEGTVNGEKIGKGSHFILTSQIEEAEYTGRFEAIVSWCKGKYGKS